MTTTTQDRVWALGVQAAHNARRLPSGLTSHWSHDHEGDLADCDHALCFRAAEILTAPK